MICLDPNAPNETANTMADKEWSVEEIAQMQQPVEVDATDLVSEQEAENMTSSAEVNLPPISIAKRKVSGRYRGVTPTYQIELRVDVDGKRPTKRVSGDIFKVSGATTTYFGSFIVNNPTITVTSSKVTITGTGSFSFITLFPVVKVTIPRVPIFAPPAPASLVFADATGAVGSTYSCAFMSPYFRTIQFEQDFVTGTTPFTSYDTGTLPSGGPSRTLSVVSSFAEAGIEMQSSSAANEVPVAGAGIDARWSNAELHASMLQQFSLWQDQPQWKVWLLVATLHEQGAGLRGIMFDQQGRQRQGCAVFHNVIGGNAADIQRAALRTYVHELGHCFNLLHSWQKSLAVPPAPNRLDALSWMNYVQNYPGGASAYWAAFPFQFDDPEIVHLRHAFRDNVIMGGKNFLIGSAEFDAQPFFEQIENNSGLELKLEARKSFVLGEPVVVEVKLYATDKRGRRVHSNLHPQNGFVQIAIQKPGGQMVPYIPFLQQCTDPEFVVLDENNPSIYTSAYIGYGKDGFYFEQTGFYQIRAIYYAIDGSEVISNTLDLRISSPLTKEDEEIADLYFGDDQGMLFYMLGSDSEYLQKGNDAFEEVLTKHKKHPLAVYAELANGINATRNFKTIQNDKKLTERAPQPKKSVKLLSDVVDASRGEAGVDNITLNMAMRRLIRAQKQAGDKKQASDTAKSVKELFQKKKLKPHVLEKIGNQVDAALAEKI